MPTYPKLIVVEVFQDPNWKIYSVDFVENTCIRHDELMNLMTKALDFVLANEQGGTFEMGAFFVKVIPTPNSSEDLARVRTVAETFVGKKFDQREIEAALPRWQIVHTVADPLDHLRSSFHHGYTGRRFINFVLRADGTIRVFELSPGGYN